MIPGRTSTMFLLLGIVVWLCAIGFGVHSILGYENTPGRSAEVPSTWPADSHIPVVPGLPTLVLMVHPHCPCSRASIGELARLMVQGQGLVNANVMFVRPEGLPEEWEKTDLWNSAAIIPGVKVWVDDDGTEARRFASKTSGQVMLYDASGALLFSGGITASRGHLGDNDGRSTIISLLTTGSAERTSTPVFGCPLFGKASHDCTEDSCHAASSN